MAKAILLFVLGGLLVLGNNVKAESIPDYLLECYKNTSLLIRENRFPMTIGTLVEIIRKIESGSTMDMRNLASSLLHMFRVDGIEFMTDTVPQEGVLPYGVVGDERYKWEILRSYIERPTVPFPNNTITAIEKCTLHFMLSRSVEYIVRGDEDLVCNKLRARRNVPDEPSTDNAKAENSQEVGKLTSAETGGEKPISVGTGGEQLTSLDKHSENVEETENSEETLVVSGTSTEKINITLNTNFSTEKSFMPSAESNSTFGQEVTDTELVATHISMQRASKIRSSVRVGSGDLSSCPIENGVIYTKYGSVNIGDVIAGIATGLNPMDAPFSGNASFNNFWAVTLAGDSAEVSVHQGPTSGNTLSIGAEGGWNNTALPRHYFVKRNTKLELTDAEIRGDLDGLTIAKNIKNWIEIYQKKLSLSQLLSLYYSEDGVISKDARACERKTNFSLIVPLQETVQQTYGFAKLLNEKSEAQEVENKILYAYSMKAAESLIAFVPSMPQERCSIPNDMMTYVNASRNVELDLYIIIDTNWNFNDIRTLLIQIADKIELYRGRKTAISVIASDGFRTIVNSTNSINDLYQWFNESTYNGRGQQMDIQSLLEKDLFNYFSNQLDIMKQKNEGAAISTVVLFLPKGSINLDETHLNAAQKAVSKYKSVIPDLHFIYYVSTGGDRLNSLVENPSTDIITATLTNENIFDVKKLVARLSQEKRRIYNPVCGATGKTESYNTVKYNEYIPWKYVNYYKLSSKYLFGVKSGNIKVHEHANGKIRICYSREVEDPLWSSNADTRVTCLISYNNDSTIPLSSPCQNYEFYYQCPPLYVSIEAFETLYKCQDASCRLPTDVLVTISHEGLTCGVGCILSSKFLLAMTIMFILKNIVSVN